MPPGTMGDRGDHPGMTVAGPVSRRSRMEEGPGSVLGSGHLYCFSAGWPRPLWVTGRLLSHDSWMWRGFKEIRSGKLQTTIAPGRPITRWVAAGKEGFLRSWWVEADGCTKTLPVRSGWGYKRLPSLALPLPDHVTLGQSIHLSWPRCFHL